MCRGTVNDRLTRFVFFFFFFIRAKRFFLFLDFFFPRHFFVSSSVSMQKRKKKIGKKTFANILSRSERNSFVQIFLFFFIIFYFVSMRNVLFSFRV